MKRRFFLKTIAIGVGGLFGGLGSKLLLAEDTIPPEAVALLKKRFCPHCGEKGLTHVISPINSAADRRSGNRGWIEIKHCPSYHGWEAERRHGDCLDVAKFFRTEKELDDMNCSPDQRRKLYFQAVKNSERLQKQIANWERQFLDSQIV